MRLADLQKNPAAFRQSLLIDTDNGPRPLGDCLDAWQAKDFAALDSGWRRAARQKVDGGFLRAWLERPRGHSKTLDLAVMATWILFAARRRLSGIAAAGDLDQARLLRDSIGKLFHLNPWLANILELQSFRIINQHTQSSLEILSSDAPTSYGLTPDFEILDEVTHWKKRDLWDSLISSAAKRASCMVVVITNAGMLDDWQWQAREAIRNDPNWYFSRLDGPQASWMTPERLAEQERLLPPIAYRRLWCNEWSSGAGDAITEEDINAAFKDDLAAVPSKHPNYEFVAGLDLGVSRDAAAICVLGVRKVNSWESNRAAHGRIRLAYTQLWRPPKRGKINLQDIEDELVVFHEGYEFKAVNFDPWEARHMSQRLALAGLPMVEVPPAGKHLQAIATATIEAFADRRLDLYEHADLRRDLRRLRVEERSYGFRLTSPRDEYGHGDLGTAFCLALLAATERAGQRAILVGGADSEPSLDSRIIDRLRQRLREYVEENTYDASAERRASLLAHFPALGMRRYLGPFD